MNEHDMDEKDPLFEETSSNEVRNWLQENLRVIVSVFIVGAIALGIYSYSQRTETVSMDDLDTAALSEMEADVVATDDAAVSSTTKGSVAQAPAEVSRETEGAFIETAVAGNGSTHLARQALMNYLEKNPDSSLSAEHKVYIEDYLRKNVGHQGGVHVGTSIEFSKDLINKAIGQSKNLNDRQLNNLKKYSVHVAAYR